MYQCLYCNHNDTLRSGRLETCRVYSEPFTVNALPHNDVWRLTLCSTQYREYSFNALLHAVERTTSTAANDDALHSAVLSPSLKMLSIYHMVITLANISSIMATTNSYLSKILHMPVKLCHMKRPTNTQTGTFPAIASPVCGVREGLRLEVSLVSPCHPCFFPFRTRGASVRRQTGLFLLRVFLSLLTRGILVSRQASLSLSCMFSSFLTRRA